MFDVPKRPVEVLSEMQLALTELPCCVYFVRLDINGANATQRVTVIR